MASHHDIDPFIQASGLLEEDDMGAFHWRRVVRQELERRAMSPQERIQQARDERRECPALRGRPLVKIILMFRNAEYTGPLFLSNSDDRVICTEALFNVATIAEVDGNGIPSAIKEDWNSLLIGQIMAMVEDCCDRRGTTKAFAFEVTGLLHRGSDEFVVPRQLIAGAPASLAQLLDQLKHSYADRTTDSVVPLVFELVADARDAANRILSPNVADDLRYLMYRISRVAFHDKIGVHAQSTLCLLFGEALESERELKANRKRIIKLLIKEQEHQVFGCHRKKIIKVECDGIFAAIRSHYDGPDEDIFSWMRTLFQMKRQSLPATEFPIRQSFLQRMGTWLGMRRPGPVREEP